jgi:hypothetical protein
LPRSEWIANWRREIGKDNQARCEAIQKLGKLGPGTIFYPQRK